MGYHSPPIFDRSPSEFTPSDVHALYLKYIICRFTTADSVIVMLSADRTQDVIFYAAYTATPKGGHTL